MVRYTTPQLTLTINDENVNLLKANYIFVTFDQNSTTLTKTGEDLEIEGDRTIKLSLTQEESKLFSTGPVKVQINWIETDLNGGIQRFATGIKTLNMTPNLLEEVVERDES